MSKAAPIGKPVETKNLELSLLRTFLALVQHGSMGKTAAAARVTQPAVSAQVLRLENIVGRRLFVRNRNGAKLTSHGELLITYANRAVALNEEALARLRGETMRKRVTLGMSTEVALIGFATAMKQFRSLHQDLELRVVVTSPKKLDTLLKAGKLDLAIADPAFMTKRPAAKWLVPLAIFGGWSISAINMWQTGPYLTPITSPSSDPGSLGLVYRGTFQRPDCVGNGNLANPTAGDYFNINAFKPAPSGPVGNCAVGSLLGPGTVAIAGGISKTFAVGERVHVKIESTFTNLPNHLNYAPPAVDVSSPATFGKTTSVQTSENAGNRSGQVALRIEF
jgi:hypothetical protein